MAPTPDAVADSPADADSAPTPASPASDDADDDTDSAVDGASADDADESDDATDAEPSTLRSHVAAVIDADTGTARLLDAEFGVITETEPAALIEAIEAAADPYALVVDGECSQRLLDVAAQHGLDHIVAASTGEFVKQPIGTRVVTAAELQPPEPELEA